MSPYTSIRFSAFATGIAGAVLYVHRLDLANQWGSVVLFLALLLNTFALWKNRRKGGQS